MTCIATDETADRNLHDTFLGFKSPQISPDTGSLMSSVARVVTRNTALQNKRLSLGSFTLLVLLEYRPGVGKIKNDGRILKVE